MEMKQIDQEKTLELNNKLRHWEIQKQELIHDFEVAI